MAVTVASPVGIFPCPKVLSPQATTVPSLLRARFWKTPAAMAMTSVRSLGTVDASSRLLPQAITVPGVLLAVATARAGWGPVKRVSAKSANTKA